MHPEIDSPSATPPTDRLALAASDARSGAEGSMFCAVCGQCQCFADEG